MAAPRRYYSPNYRFTSSLSSGLKKMQNLEDTEMKFKWDTNQIDNAEYLSYAKKRSKEVDSPTDQIKWFRNINSIESEIRSDMRAQGLYEISKMPGYSSAEIKAKAELYYKIADQAYQDGDNDAYISAMTQGNNLFDQLNMALEKEARAGSAAAKRELTRQLDLMEDEPLRREQIVKAAIAEVDPNTIPDITPEEITRYNNLIKDPGAIAYENVVISSMKMDVKEKKLESYSKLDPNDPNLEDIKREIVKLNTQNEKFAKAIDWNKDAVGNRTTPIMASDGIGNTSVKLAEGFTKRFDEGGNASIYDSKRKKSITYSTDEDGNVSTLEVPFNETDENYYTDPNTGNQYKISAPSNAATMYNTKTGQTPQQIAKLQKSVNAGEGNDTRYFTAPDVIPGQKIKYRLNPEQNKGARPITDSSLDQELINQYYTKNAQTEYAKNAGLDVANKAIPIPNPLTGKWDIPKEGGTPYVIPGTMSKNGLNIPGFEQLGFRAPGLSPTGLMAGTRAFNSQFLTPGDLAAGMNPGSINVQPGPIINKQVQTVVNATPQPIQKIAAKIPTPIVKTFIPAAKTVIPIAKAVTSQPVKNVVNAVTGINKVQNIVNAGKKIISGIGNLIKKKK